MPPVESVPEGPTVREAVRWAIGVLTLAGCDTPRLDAELLLSDVLAVGRTALLARWDDVLSVDAAFRYRTLVRSRARRIPLAYLTGERPFYDLDLFVGPGVLVPRPETELLIDEVLGWCRTVGPEEPTIADVGTGSGAIAVALATHLPRCRVVATDVSEEALVVAARNVARYGLAERVSLLHADLLADVPGPFDVIAANLPYVPSARLSELAPEVRDHEPRLALDGGPDGLDLIARVIPQAAELLRVPGLVALEIDETQGDAVAALARQQWPLADVRRIADLAGLDRLLCIAVGEPARFVKDGAS